MSRTRKGAALAALSMVLLATTPGVGAATTGAGSAGVARGLPDTPSAATVTGRGKFSKLKVTVNQTKNLVNQAISVTWTGGDPTGAIGAGFSSNFLQIFQCWGDPDGAFPSNPGPSPERCEFGAQPTVNVEKSIPGNPGYEYTRIVGDKDFAGFDPTDGILDPVNKLFLWKPFRAVDGTVTGAHIGPDPKVKGVAAWLNTSFSFTTSNEDPWGKTFPDGTGAELFQAATGLEAPGLGCGQKVQPAADGTTSVPKCWLVIVPRGTAEDENRGFHDKDVYVTSSPLRAAAWANRIAVPLEFNPVDSSCAAGAKERQVVGGELAIAAVHSWQPTLCAVPGASPYAYSSQSEDLSRQQLIRGGAGAAGMAIVSRPIDPKVVDPENSIVYAPLLVSGVVIGFNVERKVDNKATQEVKDAQAPLEGTRVDQIHLTPRLVAKLLTESYLGGCIEFPGRSETADSWGSPDSHESVCVASRPSHRATRVRFTVRGRFRYSLLAQFFGMSAASGAFPPDKDHAWVNANPYNVQADPDFLRFNAEFSNLTAASGQTMGSVVVEASTSDAAETLWRWVLADPEAKAWLSGTPDAWGMVVNPLYKPLAAAAAPKNFPKNDPYCSSTNDTKVESPPVPVAPRCRLDFEPYTLTMQAAAQATRAANTGAKTTAKGSPNNTGGLDRSSFWGDVGPQARGSRSIMSVTDAASAARYGLQAASLSRAGDDADTRSFVAPDAAGLVAGAAAMVPSPVEGVRQPDPSTKAAGAYPLTMLSYAAVTPKPLDAAARADYAAFVTYGIGDGQKPGVEFGRLPLGYAPLPDDLRAQAKAAVALIRDGFPATTTAPTPTPRSGAASSSNSGSTAPSNGGSGTGTGSSSPGGSGQSATGPTGAAKTSPTATVPPTARSVAKTLGIGVGAVRFALPVALLVGLIAAGGAVLASRPRAAAGAGSPPMLVPPPPGRRRPRAAPPGIPAPPPT